MKRFMLCVLMSTVIHSLGCNQNTPDDAEEASTMRPIQGPGWSTQIPENWQRHDAFYVGPDRANLLVNVRAIPTPLASLAENTKRDLHTSLNGYVLISERLDTTQQGMVHLLEGRYMHDQTPVRTTTGVFERRGSQDKVVMTLSVVEDSFAANTTTFDTILASVRLH